MPRSNFCQSKRLTKRLAKRGDTPGLYSGANGMTVGVS